MKRQQQYFTEGISRQQEFGRVDELAQGVSLGWLLLTWKPERT